MGLDNEVYLCRPDLNHYCIECCSGSRANCPLLKDLADGNGIPGCLGHAGNFYKGLTQPNFCQNFNCLPELSSQELTELRKKISLLPPGEFKISFILNNSGINFA